MTGICALIGKDEADLDSRTESILVQMKVRGEHSQVFSKNLPQNDKMTLGICSPFPAQPIDRHPVPIALDGVFFENDEQPHTKESAGPDRLIKTPGAFAFLTVLEDQLVAGRDVVGQKPLYFGRSGESVAFASLKQPLLSIGIVDPRPVPPGEVISSSIDGPTTVKDFSLKQPQEEQANEPEAVHRLVNLFAEAVNRTLPRHSAISFSGGLDSGLVASMAKREGLEPELISVGLNGQDELRHAQHVASELGLQIAVRELSNSEVLGSIGKVVEIVETTNPTIVGISIPIYFACDKAREMGLKYLAAGQLSDELFGGYGRFEDMAAQGSVDSLADEMFRSVIAASANDFDPGDKLAVAAGLELCCPFAYLPVVEYALKLPVSLRVRFAEGKVIRKYVLRRLAAHLKLPESVIDRPKKAVQYSSGVQRILLKEARRKGVSLAKLIESTVE